MIESTMSSGRVFAKAGKNGKQSRDNTVNSCLLALGFVQHDKLKNYLGGFESLPSTIRRSPESSRFSGSFIRHGADSSAGTLIGASALADLWTYTS